ncbi:MAG TPA: DNA-processing protein DprA [Longimicrobiaceae bacterium]
MLEYRGSAVALAQLSEEDRLFKPSAPTHDLIGAVTPEDLTASIRDVRRWLQAGRDVRSVLDDHYPRSLREIFNRPPLLFIEGQFDEARDSHSVAIVGARRASSEGRRRAARMSRAAVEAGLCVMSGLAAGIDTAAHWAALEADGRTVAVMGTGIDRIYPAENRPLADAIMSAGGCLISQFFPSQQPTRWTFPNRNITMSGLALATIVIEASETSGARMQARVALQHGRTVFLLESLVNEHAWARKYVTEGAYGTHAIMISSPEEVIERLAAAPAMSLVA